MKNYPRFYSEPDDDDDTPLNWGEIVGDDDASQDTSWLDIFGSGK